MLRVRRDRRLVEELSDRVNGAGCSSAPVDIYLRIQSTRSTASCVRPLCLVVRLPKVSRSPPRAA